jgi:hypothetical protein
MELALMDALLSRSPPKKWHAVSDLLLTMMARSYWVTILKSCVVLFVLSGSTESLVRRINVLQKKIQELEAVKQMQ